MNRQIPRRTFLSGALAALAAPALANAPARSLRPVPRPPEGQRGPRVPEGEALVSDARLDAAVAYAVADARTGLALEGRGAGDALPPASVGKALTALYALDRLGPDHRFRTRLIGTGPVREGRLTGDLVLAGGADPTLDTDGLATLANRLKESGVREVAGRFLVWGGALPQVQTIDRAQPDHVGYSPAVSGLNLNYNRVHFEWRRASGKWAVSMDARSAKYRPDVAFARMRIETRDVPVYTYADRDGRDEWTVAAGALGNGGARWLPVRKPEIYAGEVFQTLARAHGIVLKAPEVTQAQPVGDELAAFESGELRGIVADMLLYSTNITAEAIGMAASVSTNPDVSTLAGSAALMNAWLATLPGAPRIAMVDHSGLGGDSRVTADAMVTVLSAPGVPGRLRPLMKTIPMRDEKGRPDRNHPIKVEAKTGTLNFVSGLAGYMTGPDGTDLAFAIFAADVTRREALDEDERERPPGARSWNARAKALQRALIERWGALYGTT
ncbi:D-alanyl-D-alanine carboxypeptidase [Oceanicola sp. 22II-s10i]|uniref:D-alanyl-D-alanine carboxypeptidase/D-alanyl-D-alanine endopeptidase n=1 Tax=Oceanicola sp. 22II-s10i TaxID=1317116 RepID=UPI000B525072|nr:D-alanyl-D-alanine carboxypeptidase/D-alanyl-D-alanine-endopeptidase [Oceanicola sp. 22II-s10i]OWU85569.1 D-alanyl-D-alanine carboxypeptidase [Oceanicola sp. 22II-s10i]